MRGLCCAAFLLLLAGCGSDDNVRAVTPVMADTRGTYRLAFSTGTIATPDGTLSSFSVNSGSLRLYESTYTRTVFDAVPAVSNGNYAIGASVNTILNTREGSFALTSSDPPYLFTGRYRVTPDFTLTLQYDQFALPDQSVVSRSDTWVKESDSPRF